MMEMMHWLKDHAWLAGWIALPIALIPYIRQKSKGNQNVSTKGTLLMVLIIGAFISLSSPWVPDTIKMSVVTLLLIVIPFQMASLRD